MPLDIFLLSFLFTINCLCIRQNVGCEPENLSSALKTNFTWQLGIFRTMTCLSNIYLHDMTAYLKPLCTLRICRVMVCASVILFFLFGRHSFQEYVQCLMNHFKFISVMGKRQNIQNLKESETMLVDVSEHSPMIQ